MREFAGYSIIRDLTGGGMANLYVARDHQQERVIIRILREEYVRDRRIYKNFLHAGNVMGKLDHPNIVHLLKQGREGKTPYMILEYVESKNLRELILHRDPMLAQNQLSLIRQMAAALFYLHGAHLIHLDFKPENLLIRENGQVILIDFDLVVEHKNKPMRIRHVPGTPAYVAPEVLTEHIVDERADIFSFGVTCYELLCYHKPFEADTVDRERLLQMDLATPPTPLEHYNDNVPAPLRSIILKCLAKQANARYPSMSPVIKDLEALL